MPPITDDYPELRELNSVVQEVLVPRIKDMLTPATTVRGLHITPSKTLLPLDGFYRTPHGAVGITASLHPSTDSIRVILDLPREAIYATDSVRTFVVDAIRLGTIAAAMSLQTPDNLEVLLTDRGVQQVIVKNLRELVQHHPDVMRELCMANGLQNFMQASAL